MLFSKIKTTMLTQNKIWVRAEEILKDLIESYI